MDYSYYTSTSSINATNSIVESLTSILLTYSIIVLVIAILQIIAMWKIFKKAGEPGWMAIIPILNLVTLFKISGLSPLLVLVYLAGFIPVIGPIACLVLTIYQAICLSRSFGKTSSFTVGLVLLAPIFYMILGFGKAEYVGTIKE